MCENDRQKRPRPARGVRECLSCLKGNFHGQFLGGGEVAILPCYPAWLATFEKVFIPDLQAQKRFSTLSRNGLVQSPSAMAGAIGVE